MFKRESHGILFLFSYAKLARDAYVRRYTRCSIVYAQSIDSIPAASVGLFCTSHDDGRDGMSL